MVTGGGTAPDGTRWVPCKRSRYSKRLFFLDVKILSRVFRGKFIDSLKRAYYSGQLAFYGKLAFLKQPKSFEQRLNLSVRKDWIVYAKRPFSSPSCVLKYLARYTHRVAITNGRLLNLQHGRVTFQYKDYADGERTKIMPLTSSEFIRRFLMHTLPKYFVRIRYYGFLANRFRQERLRQCRSLLTHAWKRGIQGPEHDYYAGHVLGSDQKEVYIHLSQDEMVENIRSRLFGEDESDDDLCKSTHEEHIKQLEQQLNQVLQHLQQSDEAMTESVERFNSQVAKQLKL